jgi:NAD dependent epimerase/dehydratase
MNWTGRQVLVTGAGGFIGSHLVERLVGMGAHARCFVRYTSRNDIGLLRFAPAPLLREIEWVYGDLRDSDAVRSAVQGCQTVFHLGALISIPYSYVHPREVVETNVLGTLNVLEAVRTCAVEHLVHTSSSEVYGTARYVPMDEGHPLQGQSPYSASKIGADRLVESYWRSFDVPAVTVRPFNTYGPRQSARAVIPTIITQALTGDSVRLGNLHPTRDLTFVSDTVAGFIAVAEMPGLTGQEINFGSSSEISIGELVERISTMVGHPVQVASENQRKRPPSSEVERLYADTRRARELLNWSPQVALDEGLQKTVTWVSEHLDLYRPGVYQI